MSAAYLVDLENPDTGCSQCGSGRLYCIVGPDGVALGTMFDQREVAEDLAEELNRANQLAQMMQRERLLKLARWIVRQPEVRDHACEQCVPVGDMVINGFVCAVHEAKAVLEEAK